MRELLLLSSILLISTFLGVTISASEADPWSGTPLGSWVEFERNRGVSDSAERVRATVVFWSTSGKVEINARRIENRSWAEPPEQGIDLDKYGFVQEGDSVQGNEEIAGNRIPCTIYTYIRKARKKSPDDQNATGENSSERLVYWVASTIPVPARTISLNRASLNIPIGIVRCEWTSDDTIAGTRISSRITALAQSSRIGSETLECFAEDLQSSERDGDGPWENAGSWNRLLCEQVPGHVVSLSTKVRPFGEPAQTYKVTAFYRSGAIEPEAALRKLAAIPAAERPLIPSPDWSGMRAGSWCYSINLESPAYGQERASLLKRQVIEVRPDGSWIESIQNELDRQSDGYRLVEPPATDELAQPLAHPTWPPQHEKSILVRTGERTIDWEGDKLACEWALYRDPGGNRWGRDIRLYRPLKGPLREQLDKANHLWLTRIIKQRSGGEGEGRQDRVKSFSTPVTIDGKVQYGVLIEQVELGAAKGDNTSLALVSSRAPGGILATYEKRVRYGSSQQWKVLVAFGSLEDPLPAKVDGHAILAVAALGPVPFTNNIFTGQPIGTEVVYKVTARIGTQEGESRLSERVEGGTWLGIPLVRSYRLADGMRMHLETRLPQVSMDAAPQLAAGESREEQLNIGGQLIDCVHSTWSGNIGAEKWTLERWSGDQKLAPYRETAFGSVRMAVPAGTLKESIRIDCGNFVLMVERAIKKLDEPITAAGSVWSCAVEDWSLHTTGGVNITQSGTLWLNGKFPGHRVQIHHKSKNAGAPEERIEQCADSIVAPPLSSPLSSGDWKGVPIGGWVEYTVTNEGDLARPLGRHGSSDQCFRLSLAAILPEGTPVIALSGNHPDLGSLPQTWSGATALEACLAVEDSQAVQVKWADTELTGTHAIWSDAGDTRHLELTVLDGLDSFNAPLQVGQTSVLLPAGCSEAELVVLQNGLILRGKRQLMTDKADLLVAGRTLSCSRDSITVESVNSKTGKSELLMEEQRWLSLEVPGIVVRSERKEHFGESSVQRPQSRITTVTGYSKVP